jgi:autotransporter translocation and assembly factor TamB
VPALWRFIRSTAWAALVLVVLLAIGIIFTPTRSLLARGALWLALATRGVHFHAASLRVETQRIHAIGVRIFDAHGPLFSADDLTIAYDWHALFGGAHRPNVIRGIDARSPALRIVVLPDGSMNLNALVPAQNAPPPSAPGNAPSRPRGMRIDFPVHVVNGRIDVENPTAYARPGRAFAIDHIALDVHLSGERALGSLRAIYAAQGTTSHIAGTLVEDDRVGFAEINIVAPDAAVAPPLDAFVSTPLFVAERGHADLTLHAFDVGFAADSGPSFAFSGAASLRDGGLRILPISVPLRNAAGALRLSGGYVGFDRLLGTAAGLPVVASGTIRVVGGVSFALHARLAGGLSRGRALLALTHATPMDGHFEVVTQIDGPLGGVHAAVDVNAPGRLRVGNAPLANAAGSMYYHDGHLTLPHAHAAYAGGMLAGGGDFDISALDPVVQAIAVADAPAGTVPIVANLNRGGHVQTQVMLDGPASNATFEGFARTLGGRGATLRAEVSGRFGGAAAGSALIAWPHGDVGLNAAFDRADIRRVLHANIVALHAPVVLYAGGASLPGLTPRVSLPAASGLLDGTAVMRGSPDESGTLQTAIDMHGSSFNIAGAQLGALDARAYGAGPHIVIERIAVVGRDALLRAMGSAFFDPTTLAYALALHGTGQSSLAWLAKTAGIATGGRLSAEFETLASNSGWVATARSRGADATLEGKPLRDIALIAAANGARTPRFAARAAMLGGEIGATGKLDDAQVYARGLDATLLGGPLSSGTLVALGRVAQARSGTTFKGAIALADGTLRRSPIAGDADVAYAAGDLHANGRIDVAGSRAEVNGWAKGLSAGAPLSGVALDFQALVREGDAHVLAPYLPAATALSGTVNAQATVRGSASAPFVAGNLEAGAATIRGVALTQTRANFAYQGGALTIQRGHTQLGSTPLDFEGSYAPSSTSVRATSRRVDLSDFNDFFNGYDALDGTGSVTVAVALAPGRASASGNIGIANAAVAGIPLGSVGGRIGSAGDTIRVDLTQRGTLGSTDINGEVALHSYTSALPDPKHVTFDLRGRAAGVDLSGLSRFSGLEDYGVQGLLDATARATGSLQSHAVRVAFATRDASVHNVQVRAARGSLLIDDRGYSLTNAYVALPFGEATGDAGLTHGGSIYGAAHVSVADLSKLSTLFHQASHLTGSARGTIGFAGTTRRPHLRADLRAGPGAAYGVAYDDLVASATYSKDEITLGDTSLQLARGRGTLHLAGTLPLQLAPFGLGPAARPVSLTLRAQRINLDAFNPALAGAHELGGTLDATASISGTAGRPELAGTAQLRDATLTSKYERTPLHAVHADLALAHDAVTLSNLAGAIGTGSFTGEGAAHVVPAVGLRKSPGLSFYARLHVRNAPIDVPDWFSGTLNGDISLTKPGDKPYLAGDVNVRNATIPVAALYQLATALSQTSGPPPTQHIPGVPPLKPGHMIAYGGAIYAPGTHLLTHADGEPPKVTFFDLPSLNLGLTTTAQDVRVRGGPLDLLANGNLAINGSVQDPQLAGEFVAKRGTISGYGRTFRIERGVLSFSPDEGVLPSLDARAVTSIAGDRITLDVSGRVDHLNTQFSSSNGETPEQILATVITGSPTQELSTGLNEQTLAMQAQNVFSSELTRAIIFPFSNALAESLNLEEVSIAFNGLGQLVVDVRKYVTPTVSVLYETTTAAPITQAYGVGYQLRDFAAVEFSTSTSPSGFVTYRVNMRFTFK